MNIPISDRVQDIERRESLTWAELLQSVFGLIWRKP